MDQIAARLGAQLEVLVAAHEDDPQALQKLRDILSRPPFAPREKTWIERAIDSFLRFLGRLLKPIGRAIGFSGIGEALVTLLAVAALVAGLIYIIRLISGALVREARADRTKSGASDAEEEPATSSEAVSKAEELASGGDYRSAVRYLYLSTILWLHERGMLHYDRALTNYEVLRTIPPETQLHERLKPVVQTFDKVWYGHYPLDEPSFEHFRRQVAGLREGRL
ncbi:MAG: hypothetical protein KatS3mg057_3148 [Herpetosiphonaceae bacterium]|nr:MAG: hypothetical protein KatS3mg057_3148 [Herpetosiphonaceae bacterium]